MKKSGRYNRKWLRVALLLYPIVSLICFFFPFLPDYILRRSLRHVKRMSVSAGKIRLIPFSFKIRVEDLLLTEQSGLSDPKIYLSIRDLQIDIMATKLWSGEISADIFCAGPSVAVIKEIFSDLNVQPGNPLLRLNIGMDITINALDIRDGKVHYSDATSRPPLSIVVDHIDICARDISTVPERQSNAALNVRARVYDGIFQAAMTVDLLSHTPDFILDTDLSGINMVLLNDFFQRYGRFDVSSGSMAMHSEIKAVAGKFGGYVESVIEDLHVLGPEDKNDNILRYLWEGLVGLVLDIMKDHRTDELKTRIEFERPFKDPEVQVGKAVGEALANAFLHGLTPYLRNEVKINL